MTAYYSALAILTSARAADLVVTWVVTPDLTKEINPLLRHMGWTWTIVLNCIVLPFLPLIPAWQVIVLLSFGCAIFNLLNSLSD